jgi:hypothetical protein
MSGSYTVTVTNAEGCTAATSTNVTVNSFPTAGITGTTTACGSVTLTANGGTGYSWSGGNTPNTAFNTFTTSSTYTVTVTNAAGCTATTSAVVTVNSLPTAGITGTTTGCGSVTLTANGGTGYAWSGGDTPSTAVNTFTASGFYSVTVTNAAGCTAETSTNVTVNSLPTVSITGANPIFVGNTTTLSPTTGGTWASSNAAVASVTNAGVVTGVSGGTATFTFTQTSPNCSSLPTSIVTVQEGLFQNTTSNMLFTTLQDAIDAATPGQTIMLLGDVSEPNVNISNSVTINANGFTFTIPSGNLTIPIGNSLIWPSNNLIVALGANIVNNGTLCNNGIIDYNNPTAWTNTGLYKGTGTFNGSFTNNGTFSPGN